ATAENGDRMPDFSCCGYRGGGVALPDVPARVVLAARDAGDDTERIQGAIDRVAALTIDADGFRGAVWLEAGTYRVEGTLRIRESGVVLRGAGRGPRGTVIVATGTAKRALIDIRGGNPGQEIEGSRRAIADSRVPVGARTLQLVSADGLTVGDEIVVFRPGTEAWIRALGTDKLNRGPQDPVQNWTPAGYNLGFERRIVNITDTAITLDAPIVLAIEAEFGGGCVYRTHPDGRLRNVGIESLRLVSEYRQGQERSDENHAWDAVKIHTLRDGWVRDVEAVHFGYSCVNIGSGGKQITVQDCTCLDPVSQIAGGRRYSFALTGQFCLVQRCYTRGGRHDYVMHARARGPNVFLDCVADQTHSDSGPHHRWATGTLYDNVACGALNVQWRGRSGTGHGWAGANMVFWNCRARSIDCQKPPTANNVCSGCTGQIKGNGHIESKGAPVPPRSLYLQQLQDRLGPEAVRNVTIEPQQHGIIDQLLRDRFAP
ncbi:MAG: hypothetical protein JXR77_13525, partial [Lentisphaeria bacterium]|nr:hypothetical protein [Lentisphaeria bacterium]